MDMVNKMKKIAFFLVMVFSLLLYGCASKVNENKIVSTDGIVIYNLNIDNYFVQGVNRQTFEDVPKRVFVVGENETETLLALGAGPNILMTAAQNSRKYAMRKENAKLYDKLSTCSSSNLNMEYITKLKPDLIVAQQCIFTKNRLKNTEYWNKHGIKTMVPLNTNSPGKHFYNETVEKEMDFILDLGRIFRLENNAQRIVDDTYNTIAYINKKTSNVHKPHVMIVEFISYLVSYDRTKLVGNMVEHIGGTVNETPAVIGFEHIIKQNPEVLFVVCSHADYGVCIDKILTNKALQKLQCIKNKRVYSIPLRYTYGSQCRTADGIKFLAECMYPEVKFDFRDKELMKNRP